MKLLIFGPPGSGKGTQAQLLSKDFKLEHISSDILREEIKKGTLLGKKIQSYMQKGDLVPDDLMISLVKNNLSKNNFILDGFPRTLKEAKFLDKYNKPDNVIVLDVPFHTLKSRLLKRNRNDDTPELIKHRFKVYSEQTAPILKFYKDRIILVDGDRKVEEIEEDLRILLKKCK